MDKSSRLRFLFVKYMQRQCSVQEIDEMLLLMQTPRAESSLKEEMELLWEEFTDDKTQHAVDWEKMYDSIISNEKRTDALIKKATSRRKLLFPALYISFTLIAIFLLWRFLTNYHLNLGFNKQASNRNYFLNSAGNDANEGSKAKPWKTIAKLNETKLHAGDTVFFEGGQRFAGTIIIDSTDMGNDTKSIVITSFGAAKAVIDGGDGTALTAHKTKFLTISNLAFTGSGRNSGNTKDGVIINKSSNIKIDSIIVKGFQKAGLLINSSTNVNVEKVYATGNGAVGIYATGEYGKRDCSNVRIAYCTAENNPGDPTNFTNHSGNGILAGVCKNILIEYCVATDNGWDMPRKGNGPVGIWCYEADSVIIQHCISYKNKTAPGAADGGGFDLDGGVTNSIIQYCLSYENEGSGYGLFQYAGASNWRNNTVRYCVSENDGSVSAAHAGIFIWNSSEDTNQFQRCFVYNNTIYNKKGAAISYEAQSKNAGFRFYNNIFVAKDSLILGRETNSVYIGNDWYSLEKGFSINRFTKFMDWVSADKKEMFGGKVVGFNINPAFPNAGGTTLTDPREFNSYNQYILPGNSVLRNNGLDLNREFGIETGRKSINKKQVTPNAVGAGF